MKNKLMIFFLACVLFGVGLITCDLFVGVFTKLANWKFGTLQEWSDFIREVFFLLATMFFGIIGYGKYERLVKGEPMRKIFVSYFWNQIGNSGHGNTFFTIDGKVSRTTLESFRDQIIESNKFNKVVIMNWKEMEQ